MTFAITSVAYDILQILCALSRPRALATIAIFSFVFARLSFASAILSSFGRLGERVRGILALAVDDPRAAVLVIPIRVVGLVDARRLEFQPGRICGLVRLHGRLEARHLLLDLVEDELLHDSVHGALVREEPCASHR